MNLPCEVIKDLLPLYYDKVCSKESRLLVEEHLAQCPQCAGELQKLQTDFEKTSAPEGDLNLMKRISAEWKRDKKAAFARGSMLISALAAIICFISYQMIGSEVLPDGRLVEPFALLPIGYLFLLVFFLSAICSFLFFRKRKTSAK